MWQEYLVDIRHVRGKNNLIPDGLSRACCLDLWFPENCCDEIINYISILLYDHFMAKERFINKTLFSLKTGSVIYKMFNYFKYHYFHVFLQVFIELSRNYVYNNKLFLFLLENGRNGIVMNFLETGRSFFFYIEDHGSL